MYNTIGRSTSSEHTLGPAFGCGADVGILCSKTVRVVTQTMWSQCVQVMNGVTRAASSTNDRGGGGCWGVPQCPGRIGKFLHTQLLSQRKPFLWFESWVSNNQRALMEPRTPLKDRQPEGSTIQSSRTVESTRAESEQESRRQDLEWCKKGLFPRGHGLLPCATQNFWHVCHLHVLQK